MSQDQFFENVNTTAPSYISTYTRHFEMVVSCRQLLFFKMTTMFHARGEKGHRGQWHMWPQKNGVYFNQHAKFMLTR